MTLGDDEPSAQLDEDRTTWTGPSIFDEHQTALRWAATVMAREIELHYQARGDLLDQHTVEALARHLQEISLGEREPWGLVLDRGEDRPITHINYGAPTETTQLPPSAEPYVERSDTDLPAHPTA